MGIIKNKTNNLLQMKFTQILLASSVAALAGASRLRLRQDAEEEKVKGACKEMCDYYNDCRDAIRGAA